MNELTGADFKSATEMTDDNKKLFIETYGCQMNVADSEVIASVMQMAGYSVAETLEEADAVFMNTCSIRDNAEQKILNRLICHFVRKLIHVNLHTAQKFIFINRTKPMPVLEAALDTLLCDLLPVRHTMNAV